jgi:hypothetical protein
MQLDGPPHFSDPVQSAWCEQEAVDTHEPLLQTAPLPHTEPGQQGWPAVPHAVHEPLEQVAPVPQVLPAQQGWPTPPHAHVPPVQTPLVQLPPPQHGSPMPPHFAHAPVAPQTKPLSHEVPQQG